jgi:uncharacterized membrane protein
MRLLRHVVLMGVLVGASLAQAAPRSGGSFGGLRGFRGSSGGLSRGYRATPTMPGRGSYGGGSSFIFLPSFGWGYGGWGVGGGMGMVGSLFLVGIVALGAIMVVRSLRRASQRGALAPVWGNDEDDQGATSVGRAYVYRVQLGLGRSGRGVQKRLEEFASTGDTSSEEGLADLLRQTALELMREKDSIRYGLAEAGGPYSLSNGEAKLTGAATAERSRYQVERVRGNDGKVRRSDAALAMGSEALEFLVVTVLVATRQPLAGVQKLEERAALEAVLGDLAAVPAGSMLGLEVIWTPADPEDSLTETDLMTTYPEMRSL